MQRAIAGCLLTAVMLIGCSTPATNVLLFADACEYQGPTAVTAGTHDLSLHPQGLGEYSAALLALDTGTTVDDLDAHFETAEPDSNGWPDGTRVLAEVEIQGNISEESDSASLSLEPGDLVMVCVDRDALARGEDGAITAIELTVTDP